MSLSMRAKKSSKHDTKIIPNGTQIQNQLSTRLVCHISCSYVPIFEQKHPIFWSNPLYSITVTTICYFYDWLTTLIPASNLIYSVLYSRLESTFTELDYIWENCNKIWTRRSYYFFFCYIDLEYHLIGHKSHSTRVY